MKSRIINSISEISEQNWNSCTNGINPFCSYGFLNALEKSGCTNETTGWLPQHIIAEDKSGTVVGVMPLYLKNHSQGEYVFDHAWASAFQNAGGHYYPKLQCSIPFSPVTGPRLMSENAETKKFLLETAIYHAEQCGVSSLHFTFIEEGDIDVMTSHRLLHRQDQQYHWLNDGYWSFNEFLGALSSRKRKNISRERRGAILNDIEIELIQAHDINEHHWDHYFEFYMNTAHRKWGQPYLNREFFSLLSENIPENLLLIIAKRKGRYIAGALNLIGKDTLYGRYWGATEHHKFLHFELCYYQAIEFAIKNGLGKVEAGAQGDHKIARGYVPVATNSAHWISNQSFRDAIEIYLNQERRAVSQGIEYLKEFTPFKKISD